MFDSTTEVKRFDLEKFLSDARQGQMADHAKMFSYLDSFDAIILRGAGVFGSEIGKKLLEFGVPNTKIIYWDLRAAELTSIHGIAVNLPFDEKFNIDKTIIINCIPNGIQAGSSVLSELQSNGYIHCLSGMALYEAVFCQMNSKTGFNARHCLDSKACNWCCCEKLMNVLQQDCKARKLNDFEDELTFSVATFVISLKCTLQCRHCGQYINSYKKTDKINFHAERIKRDMDLFFDAVDSVGFVSIIGGEPFLHPDLSEIINYLLNKKNFGMIGITTNGICKITSEHLTTLQNDRTRVIFSNYCNVLSDAQKNLFDTNVNKVKNAGINYTIGIPLWGLPPTLKKQSLADDIKLSMKSNCSAVKTCQIIQNGIYYPCSSTASVHTHAVADYASEYVILDNAETSLALRKQIMAANNLPFYQSCEHCADGGGHLLHAGDQGIDERYSHI